MSRRFCVVYVLDDTYFRLMETAASEPAAWSMHMTEDGVPSEVEVRDVVRTENDVPTHLGVQIGVTTPATDIDAAVPVAGRLAETIVSLLSAAARAHAPSLQPFVAYEITPDVAERPLIQWFRTPDLPRGKTPVPAAAFRVLWERLPALKDERWAQRIRLSIDWHRAALRETDALFRFVGLWTALEAIGNALAEHYSVEARGWHGLRQLAEDEGYGTAIVSEILDVRRHLFHDLSIRPADVRPPAQSAVPIMEHLLIAGWTRLLGAPEGLTDFPSSTVTPYPMHYVLRAQLIAEDASQWGAGTHPYFAGRLVARRVPADKPGAVTVTYTLEVQPQNFQQWRADAIEVWGPSGPNIPTVEQVATEVQQNERPEVPEGR